MQRLIHALAAIILGLSATTNMAWSADVSSYEADGAGICGQPKYLNKIVDRFSYQVKHVPHLPDVAITDFQRIHEHRYLPESEEWPIARRYCGATAILSDGRSREVWYLIEGRMGFAGIGENVEFCVSGFDRWFVYNGRCRVLR